MTPQTPNPVVEDLVARLGASPSVYVQNFDLMREAALLVQLDADGYRAASFLDNRILGPSIKGGWIPLRRLMTAAARPSTMRPLHFIFHTGHVGSTLISRLLEEAGGVLSLREPLTLRHLAEAHDGAGHPDSLLSQPGFEALLDTFLRLWSRGFDDTRCVVLKATSAAGRLAPTLLARQPQARAIYLNLGAEPYLATLLAGRNSAIDLRGHGPERMRRLRPLGVSQPIYDMSPGEISAMSWLAESLSQSAARKAGGDRLLCVDFDGALSDIAHTLSRIAAHLGVPHDTNFAAHVAQSPALTRYAKAPEHAYTPQLRGEILADSRSRNRDEIRKGLSWLERVARAHAGAAEVVGRAGI